MNTFVLEDKVCLMTGGLGGIAVGVATLMLERGAKVFLCDLEEDEAKGLSRARTAAAVGKAAGKEDRIGYATVDVTNKDKFRGE